MLGSITSHNPTPLEELINQGYVEKSKSRDGTWIVLENQEGGIIYDIQRNVIITPYKFEMWQRDKQ